MASVQLIKQINYKNQPVEVYELKADDGTSAVISNYGCIIQSLVVKDKNGNDRDVVLGFDSIEDYWNEDYLNGYPYFGAIIGRYANRIKGAKFLLNGETIQLTQNKGTNILHGGDEGFDRKIWTVINQQTEPDVCIKMQYKSAAGEEGFPGNLLTTITFRLLNHELIYEISAVTDAPTAINFAHHGYFNLDQQHTTVDQQQVKINADYWLQQDEEFCVTGKMLPTADSPFDFSDWKPVVQEWNKEDGYDQTFVVNRTTDDLMLAAEAKSSDEALHLQVYTTEPVVHFYTGKWIPVIKGKRGEQYQSYSAYCFETQHHPNAVNIPSAPTTILNPGEEFRQVNSYRFK